MPIWTRVSQFRDFCFAGNVMDCDVTYCTHVSAHPWSIVHNLRTVTIIHQHHWQILFPSPLSYGWTVEFVCTSARAICIIDLAWQCRWKSDTNSTVQVFKFVFAPLFLACLSRYVCVEQYALWVASTWFFFHANGNKLLLSNIISIEKLIRCLRANSPCHERAKSAEPPQGLWHSTPT